MRVFQISIVTLAFIVIAYVSQSILHNFPNSADEYAYVFQAKNLARFQTYADIHPRNAQGEHIQPYFYLVHIGDNHEKYYGRFPFGYSLLMVPAAWFESLTGLNVYWLTNTVFGALTIFLLFQFGLRFFNRRTAILAAVMGLLSSWFLLNSGSYFSHTTNAFFVGLFLYAFCLALDQKSRKDMQRWFFIAGFCFGFAVIIRFLDPMPYLLVLLVLYWLWASRSKKVLLKDVLFFVMGGAFWAVCLFYYNYSLTGDALQTAYQYYNPHDQGTRFVFMVPDNQGGNSIEWNRIYDIGYQMRTWPNIKLLFDWHVWAWLSFLFPLVFLIRKESANHRTLAFIFLLAPVLVVVTYMLYGGPPANQYGPRYYYSFFVPITLLSAFCFAHVFTKKRYLIPATGILSVYAISQIVEHATDFEEQVYERVNVFRTIEAAELENAVVILKTGSGSMHQVDLPRNSLDFDNEVLVVQERGGQYGALIRAYPERKFYEYYYRGKGRLGKLVQLFVEPDGRYTSSGSAVESSRVLYGAQGFAGKYYSGKDFDKLLFQRLDKEVNFDWKNGAPVPVLPVDAFSVRWEGMFEVEKPGVYLFETTSDDGVQLRVNDKVVINNWYGHGALTERASVQLSKGRHYLRLDYFDERYGAMVNLSVQKPGQRKEILSGEDIIPVIGDPVDQ